MLATRIRSHRASGAVDIAAILGAGDTSRLPAGQVEVSRGMAGAERLQRLAMAAIVIEGVVLRSVRLGVRVSASLYGPGDVLPSPQQEPAPFLTGNRVLTPVRLAPLDNRLRESIGAQPELALALAERVTRHTDMLALQCLLSQLVSIEERLGVLLPHLAERWGTVTADGVVLPPFLSHTVLAALVGVRRPSLTTAIAALAERGLFARLPDRRWLVAPVLAGLATA